MATLLIEPTYVQFASRSKSTYNPASAHQTTPRRKKYFHRKFGSHGWSFYNRDKKLSRSVYQKVYGNPRERIQRSPRRTQQKRFRLPTAKTAGAPTRSFARRAQRAAKGPGTPTKPGEVIAGLSTQKLASRAAQPRRGTPDVPDPVVERPPPKVSRRKVVVDASDVDFIPSMRPRRASRKQCIRPTTANPILQRGDRYKQQFRPSCRVVKGRNSRSGNEWSPNRSRRRRIIHPSVVATNTVTKKIMGCHYAKGPNREDQHFEKRRVEKSGYESALKDSLQVIHHENAGRYNYYRQRKNAGSKIFEKPLYLRNPPPREPSVASQPLSRDEMS